MAVIAMTREMATRGKDVAAGLAQRLSLTVVHHEVVEHDIAERCGMRESEVHRFLEGEASLLERWKIDRKRVSRYTAQEILELAVKGGVLMQRLGVNDRALARREIERNDAAHNGTMQKMFGIDWTDASHYAIVLNT